MKNHNNHFNLIKRYNIKIKNNIEIKNNIKTVKVERGNNFNIKINIEIT